MNNHEPPLAPLTKPNFRERWAARKAAFIAACRDPWTLGVNGGLSLLVIVVLAMECFYLFGPRPDKFLFQSHKILAAQAPFLFRYDLMEPLGLGNEPGRRYPLVVVLAPPGGSTNVAQMTMQPRIRDRFPAYVMVVRIPRRAAWFTPDDPRIELGERQRLFPDALPIVPTMVAMAARTHAIDPERLYLIGDKEGGVGALALLDRMPGLFVGAVVTAGAGSPEIIDLWRTPLRIFHGGADDVYDPFLMQQLAAAVKIAGGDTELTIIPGAGHDIVKQVYELEGLWQWLFARKRPPPPRPASIFVDSLEEYDLGR